MFDPERREFIRKGLYFLAALPLLPVTRFSSDYRLENGKQSDERVPLHKGKYYRTLAG